MLRKPDQLSLLQATTSSYKDYYTLLHLQQNQQQRFF